MALRSPSENSWPGCGLWYEIGWASRNFDGVYSRSLPPRALDSNPSAFNAASNSAHFIFDVSFGLLLRIFSHANRLLLGIALANSTRSGYHASLSQLGLGGRLTVEVFPVIGEIDADDENVTTLERLGLRWRDEAWLGVGTRKPRASTLPEDLFRRFLPWAVVGEGGGRGGVGADAFDARLVSGVVAPMFSEITFAGVHTGLSGLDTTACASAAPDPGGGACNAAFAYDLEAGVEAGVELHGLGGAEDTEGERGGKSFEVAFAFVSRLGVCRVRGGSEGLRVRVGVVVVVHLSAADGLGAAALGRGVDAASVGEAGGERDGLMATSR